MYNYLIKTKRGSSDGRVAKRIVWYMNNYNFDEQHEEMERELTLPEYIDELNIPEDVLETNVYGL